MKLQTQIPLKPVQQHHIDYKSALCFFGSCFSEHISERLIAHKLPTFSNPFGILFHPKAIENLIKKSITDYSYSTNDVFDLNEQFQCFEVHSKLNTIHKTELIKRLNEVTTETLQQLKKASHICMTLGTAWVHKHIASDKTVANCHKVPQKEFNKTLLSIEEITASLQNCMDLILSVNPEAQFIFTVSPVRHIKDGFTENTLSKAHLISAVHAIVNTNSQAHYFPSYEIIMDQLRDYRFYNEDMLHPNTTAINFIWKQFKTVWFSEEAQNISTEIAQITRGLNHKPFNPNSEAHKKFLLQLNSKKTALLNKFPHISF